MSLYLIPLSVIVSSASIRSAREKQILLNNELFSPSDEDFHQQGFLGRTTNTFLFLVSKRHSLHLGCKYDADLCKVNEFCFDGKLIMLIKFLN